MGDVSSATSARLEVWGERAEGEPDRWKQVGLSVRDQPARFHDTCAEVAVDRARLIFIDVDALAEWKHTESIDGLADFVFWGRDAAEVAREHGAPALGGDQFGWENLPLKDGDGLPTTFPSLGADAQGARLADGVRHRAAGRRRRVRFHDDVG